MNKFKLGLVGAAVMGLLTANPVAAAGATRSAAALPLLAASVGSVAYKSGAEKTWRCTEVNDEALKLNKDYVNVDTAGRVVVDPNGVPFACNNPNGAIKGGKGIPFELLVGTLGLAGAVALVLAGGASKSTG